MNLLYCHYTIYGFRKTSGLRFLEFRCRLSCFGKHNFQTSVTLFLCAQMPSVISQTNKHRKKLFVGRSRLLKNNFHSDDRGHLVVDNQYACLIHLSTGCSRWGSCRCQQKKLIKLVCIANRHQPNYVNRPRTRRRFFGSRCSDSCPVIRFAQ